MCIHGLGLVLVFACFIVAAIVCYFGIALLTEGYAVRGILVSALGVALLWLLLSIVFPFAEIRPSSRTFCDAWMDEAAPPFRVYAGDSVD
jgi:4-amino-4-deoxy-L-arabinose transferase-like glycosyltransferase